MEVRRARGAGIVGDSQYESPSEGRRISHTMPKSKIAITVDREVLERLAAMVRRRRFPNLSRALEVAAQALVDRLDHPRLAQPVHNSIQPPSARRPKKGSRRTPGSGRRTDDADPSGGNPLGRSRSLPRSPGGRAAPRAGAESGLVQRSLWNGGRRGYHKPAAAGGLSFHARARRRFAARPRLGEHRTDPHPRVDSPWRAARRGLAGRLGARARGFRTRLSARRYTAAARKSSRSNSPGVTGLSGDMAVHR